ncbi:MAG: D-sedoheptulose-7-phosphate isomerase [Candidatus Merdivicinus sp.]|jgi:D-sedoheptulose 7-phosphate isomerase
MNERAKKMEDSLFARIPELESMRPNFETAVELICHCFQKGGKLLSCGNGGSAADSEHIVGELMKGFLLKRPLTQAEQESIRKTGCADPEGFAAGLQRGLPAISLVSQTALMTAFLNDVQPDMLFAQQVFAYGVPGDVLIALSTSGNSANVVNAAIAAKAKGVKIIALTGQRESRLSALADATLRAPELETFRIQEYHLALYHALCACVEMELFEK